MGTEWDSVSYLNWEDLRRAIDYDLEQGAKLQLCRTFSG